MAKKYLSFCISALAVFVIIASSFLTVSAAGSANLDISANQISDNGTEHIKVHAEINNITDPTGVVCVDYKIHYDTSVFALESAKINMPEVWKPYADSEMAEILEVNNPGIYKWSIVNAEVGTGIKENGQLFVDLDFVKKDTEKCNTEIIFECISVNNDRLENMACESKTIYIETSLNKDPVINETTEEIPDESEESPDTSESDNSNNTSNEGSLNVSIGTGDDSQIKPGKPIKPEETDTNNVSDSIGKDNQNSYVWVYIAVGAVALIAVIIIVILVLRKKKGQTK